jgi:hypothetical protein
MTATAAAMTTDAATAVTMMNTMKKNNALGYPLLQTQSPVPSDIAISQQIVKEVGLLSLDDVARQLRNLACCHYHGRTNGWQLFLWPEPHGLLYGYLTKLLDPLVFCPRLTDSAWIRRTRSSRGVLPRPRYPCSCTTAAATNRTGTTWW